MTKTLSPGASGRSYSLNRSPNTAGKYRCEGQEKTQNRRFQFKFDFAWAGGYLILESNEEFDGASESIL